MLKKSDLQQEFLAKLLSSENETILILGCNRTACFDYNYNSQQKIVLA